MIRLTLALWLIAWGAAAHDYDEGCDYWARSLALRGTFIDDLGECMHWRETEMMRRALYSRCVNVRRIGP